MGERVVVAMSGGVDSAVAAWLLRERGHEVTGLFMNNGVYAEDAGQGRRMRTCCSAHDSRDAAACARGMGVPYHEVNFKAGFARVIERFAAEYGRGRTPNPCVQCNAELKFGKLLAWALAMGAERVATGHYARLERDAGTGRWFVRRAADRQKDQSYVLSGLGQEQLARALFPLGDLTKPEVRQVAARAGLPVRDKPESQDICFVPEGDYRPVLASRGLVFEPGEIRDTGGRVVGRHGGVAGFTIGQRRGIRVALGSPRYVVRLEPETATVVIGTREELASPGLVAAGVVWMRHPGLGPGEELEAWTKIRYHHEPACATVRGLAEGRVEAAFEEPQLAVTPGQTVCFYDEGGGVLAGGVIEA